MKKLVVMVVMMLGLAGAWWLVGRTQLLQRRASVGTVNILLLPSEANLRLGQTIEMVVKMDTGGEVVNGIEAKLNFEKDEIGLVAVTPQTSANAGSGEKAFFKNSTDLMGLVTEQAINQVNSQGWLKIKGIRVEDSPANYQSGIINLVKLRFVAKKDGVAKVWIDQTIPPVVVGYKSGEAVVVAMASSVRESNFTIGGVSGVTTMPKLTPVLIATVMPKLTPVPTTIVGVRSSVWTKLANQLPEGLAPYYATALDGTSGRVYVVGGYTASAARISSQSVYKGVIGSDGSINWTKQMDYPVRVKGSYAFIMNGRLYNVGGDDSAGIITNKSYSTPIDGSGNLGAWRLEAGMQLPMGNHFMAGLKFKGRIYVMGGRNLSNNLEYSTDRVYRLKTTMDGWEAVGVLPDKLGMLSVASWGDFIYIGGGQVMERSNVYRCDTGVTYRTTLTTSGSLGSWIKVGDYPGVNNAYYEVARQSIPSLGIRSAHMMQVANGKMYILPAGTWARSANNSDDGSQCRNVAAKPYKKPEYMSSTTRSLTTSINADGSLGSISIYGHSVSNRSLDLGLWNLDGLPYGYYGSFVYGGRIYMIGGMNFAGVTKNIYWMSL